MYIKIINIYIIPNFFNLLKENYFKNLWVNLKNNNSIYKYYSILYIIIL